MANTNTSSQSYPAVSVIMPMYNVEKYIGEALDSLLNQTLQDFEVIVVNDCSTDNSRQIAETYLEKFGGRLKIYDNEKNSGPSASRNNGLLKASGEYIFFMDSDDLLLLGGLEKIYSVAKDYDVDVVSCTKNYELSADGMKLTAVNLKINTTDEIILDEDIEWRIKKQLRSAFGDTCWRKLAKRVFLLENKLFLPEDIKRCEDVVWTYSLLFHAKKVVYLPSAIYLHRLVETSLSKKRRSSLENINTRMKTVINGTKWLGKDIDDLKIFKNFSEYNYVIFEHLINRMFWRCFKSTLVISQFDIYQHIKEEFGEKLGEQDILVAELCSLISEQKKEISKLSEQLKTK